LSKTIWSESGTQGGQVGYPPDFHHGNPGVTLTLGNPQYSDPLKDGSSHEHDWQGAL